jgi:ribosome-associated heat shock protein Hsp15
MLVNKEVRVDQYLWAVRMYKTRSQASKAIAEGKVKLNGEPVKASHTVRIGEQYNMRLPERKLSIQVVSIINKRVQYSEAILKYFDISSEEEKDFNSNKQATSFFSGKRLSKIGRPTKKNARDITDFLNNDTPTQE